MTAAPNHGPIWLKHSMEMDVAQPYPTHTQPNQTQVLKHALTTTNHQPRPPGKNAFHEQGQTTVQAVSTTGWPRVGRVQLVQPNLKGGLGEQELQAICLCLVMKCASCLTEPQTATVPSACPSTNCSSAMPMPGPNFRGNSTGSDVHPGQESLAAQDHQFTLQYRTMTNALLEHTR